MSRYRYVIIGSVLVISGSLKTLSSKWADRQESLGTERTHRFIHPAFQLMVMFVGEFLCLPVYFVREAYYRHKYGSNYQEPRSFNPFLFLPATFLDSVSSASLLMALTLTTTSNYQFLHGSLIIFTALLSIAFLRHRIKLISWIGIGIIICDGFMVVGIAYGVFGVPENKHIIGIISGDLLIIFAQILTAIFMVYCEFILKSHDVVPLKAVGLDGLFGIVIWGILLIPFYFIDGGSLFQTNPEHRVEDVRDAVIQMKNDPIIIVATIGYMISVTFYDVAMMVILKRFDATTYTIVNSLTTAFIWFFSLAVRWEHFHYLQFIGIVLLIFGVVTYFDITIMPLLRRYCCPVPHSNRMRVDVQCANEAVTNPLLSPGKFRNNYKW